MNRAKNKTLTKYAPVILSTILMMTMNLGIDTTSPVQAEGPCPFGYWSPVSGVCLPGERPDGCITMTMAYPPVDENGVPIPGAEPIIGEDTICPSDVVPSTPDSYDQTSLDCQYDQNAGVDYHMFRGQGGNRMYYSYLDDLARVRTASIGGYNYCNYDYCQGWTGRYGRDGKRFYYFTIEWSSPMEIRSHRCW